MTDPADLSHQCAAAARVLREGGLVAVPTDTYYGLAVDPARPAAVARLGAVKGREPGKPILLLLPDRTWASRLAGPLPATFDRLADRFWPGPLTLVVPAGPGLAPELLAGGTTIGLRWPRAPFLEALFAVSPSPVTGTSANRSGEPPLRTAAQIRAALGAAVDLVVEGPPCPGGPPSTVLDLTVTPPRVLRPGAVSEEAIRRGLSAAD